MGRQEFENALKSALTQMDELNELDLTDLAALIQNAPVRDGEVVLDVKELETFWVESLKDLDKKLEDDLVNKPPNTLPLETPESMSEIDKLDEWFTFVMKKWDLEKDKTPVFLDWLKARDE